MTYDEVVDLLTLISARDNRKVSKGTVLAWCEDIGDLAFEDCREGVRRHFRESTDWLMAAHIRRHVQAIHEARQNDGMAVYRELKARDPKTEEEYRQALKDIRARLRSSQPLPFKAIEAARDDASDGPSEEYMEIRKDRDEQREAAALAKAREEIDWSQHATCGTCDALLDPDGTCFACTHKADGS